jgi:ParB-like chromosome segregation protein Spo0J
VLGPDKEKTKMETKRIEEIKTHPLFEGIFTINGELLGKIERDMRDGRYDISQPIILATWEGQKEPVCIDGHTRLKAAMNAGIEEVPVFLHEFDTEQEALEKAIKLQRNRRNMTDAEIMACIEALDKRKPRGGDRRSEDARSKVQRCTIENESSLSAHDTGKLLGISQRKVNQARTVMDHAEELTKEAVKQGDMSINQAYQKTQKKRKQTGTEPLPGNSELQATDEGQKPEQAGEVRESTGAAPVLVSMEHYKALNELGGSIEEHVASAIDLYLESLREQDEENPAEHHQEDDDDEEYFDPDNYDD